MVMVVVVVMAVVVTVLVRHVAIMTIMAQNIGEEIKRMSVEVIVAAGLRRCLPDKRGTSPGRNNDIGNDNLLHQCRLTEGKTDR